MFPRRAKVPENKDWLQTLFPSPNYRHAFYPLLSLTISISQPYHDSLPMPSISPSIRHLGLSAWPFDGERSVKDINVQNPTANLTWYSFCSWCFLRSCMHSYAALGRSLATLVPQGDVFVVDDYSRMSRHAVGLDQS